MAERDEREMREAECNLCRARVEFMEKTLECYRALPLTLAGAFDPSECTGNCRVLRDNFRDVWSTNAGLNKRVESEVQTYTQTIHRNHARIAELEALNAHLEQCVSRLGAQLDEKRRSVEGCPPRLWDMEEFFAKKLDESAATSAVMQERVTDLKRALHLKEQESASRQAQINHMLALPNQLEHASEVNKMRVRLCDAGRRIQVLMAQTDSHGPPDTEDKGPKRKAAAHVDLQQDPRLAERFADFFVVADRDGAPSDANTEEHLCSQFLLDQPKLGSNRLKPDSYTREEAIGAMHKVSCADRKKSRLGTVCKRKGFAACLAAMGGRFRLRKGLRYWVNVVAPRRPMFTWDI